MRILAVIEHDGSSPKPGSLAAVGFAQAVAERNGGHVASLVIGHTVAGIAEILTSFGIVYFADSPALANPLADRYAQVIVDAVSRYHADMLVAASSTYAKDIVGRAAGLLGGAMVSDVVAHDWRDGQLLFVRPMHAGMVTETVILHGDPKIVTIRPTAYPQPIAMETQGELFPIAVQDPLPVGMMWEHLESKLGTRPDVTDARIVVAGGRAIADRHDFERLVGGLADCLDGAIASTRALVDAGIAPNSLQVGQTGKIIAPELYIALGISGAVQHLAGMKNSKKVLAINKDPNAPIFDFADYGLVGDVYDVVPELIGKLHEP
ncbi:MAG: electron transfer flavoprotein subunit alpha/FixB family protein [Pirellulales bacterium]|nr:electron transfer flavoprotein subunit alpha/FixB family protein [Pirellulales bacterium]